MAGFNLIGSIFQPETRGNYTPVQHSSKANSSKRAQKGKLSKSDIGTPDNFKHITHIGFSSLSGLDLDSDVDMKALVSLAGVKEEILKDEELPHVISDALKKEGSLKQVHKMKLRRKSVEQPNECTKPSALSSPGDTTCKRVKRSIEQSPFTTKIATALPVNIPLNYIQSLSEIPSTSSDLSSNPFPSKRPPYLKELSRAFSSNPSDSQLLYRRPFENRTPHPSSLHNKEPPAMTSCSIHSNSDHTTMKKYFLKPLHPIPTFGKALSSISSHEEDLSSKPSHESSLIKFGDLPPVPPSCVNLETILLSPLSSEPPINTEFGTVPPAPALPLKLQSDSNQPPNDHFPYENLDMPLKSQVEYLNSEEQSPKELLSQQNQQTFFLDQIRQGVQLKSVSQKLKDEKPECSSIVGALRAVIQRRHKVIHSSDDEDDHNLDWED